jgi:pteridine reductase
VVLHGRHNLHEAQAHADRLNAERPHSACAVQGDLLDMQHLPTLAHTIGNAFGRLDALIHNASSFFSTPMGQATQQDWDDLMGSNARAPFFLTQALLPHLQATQGVVLSILDIHANGQPFAGYPIYNMAKAAHRMMVQALAKDLAPDVRVNGVAPGANLWPDAHSPSALDDDTRHRVFAGCPLCDRANFGRRWRTQPHTGRRITRRCRLYTRKLRMHPLIKSQQMRMLLIDLQPCQTAKI